MATHCVCATAEYDDASPERELRVHDGEIRSTPPPLNDRGAGLPRSARFRRFQFLLGPLLLAFSAILVAVSVVSGTVLFSIIEAMFGRPRPDEMDAEFLVNSLSFPSGHASPSALVFLTLGALIAWTHRRWAARIYILMVATLMAGLVGLSRIGLGSHWATDVLGGWAFGAAWAILWLLVARHIARQDGERFRTTGAA